MSDCQLKRIKVELSRKSYATSKEIFEDANVKNVSRETRCKVLKTMASVKKLIKTRPSNKKSQGIETNMGRAIHEV